MDAGRAPALARRRQRTLHFIACGFRDDRVGHRFGLGAEYLIDEDPAEARGWPVAVEGVAAAVAPNDIVAGRRGEAEMLEGLGRARQVVPVEAKDRAVAALF